MIFLSFRGIIPGFFSVVGANTLLVIATSFVAAGIESFLGFKKNITFYVIITIITFGLFTYFFVNPDVNVRILIISLILSTLYFYTAFILQKNVFQNSGIETGFLRDVFFYQGVWLLLRILLTYLYEGNMVSFMTPSVIQGSSFIIFFVGNILITFGLMSLNYQRIENDLQESSEEVRTLRGIIPICMSCKSIRDDEGIWKRLELYIEDHSEAEFSHGICPQCMKEHYPEEAIDVELDSNN
jgi:hypothetical protein